MEWIAIVLMSLGIVTISLFTVTKRWALRSDLRLGIGPMLTESQALIIPNAVAASLMFLSAPWWNEWGMPDPVNVSVSIFWVALIGTTLFNAVIQFANVKASSKAEASLTAPIQGMTPGLIGVTATVVGEIPTPQGIVGIATIGTGTWIHGREHAKRWLDYFTPLFMLRLPGDLKERRERMKRGELDERQRAELVQELAPYSGVRWSFLSAFMGTGGLLCDALVVRNGSVALGFGIQLLLLTMIFIAMRGTLIKPTKTAKQPFRKVALASGLMGTLYALHVIFVMASFRFAPIASIGSFKRMSIVLTVIFAWWLLGETKALKRIWPAVIITAGAMLLAFDTSMSFVIDKTEGGLRLLLEWLSGKMSITFMLVMLLWLLFPRKKQERQLAVAST